MENNDISKIKYLSDSIPENLLNVINFEIRMSYESFPVKTLDCKIIEAKWITNESAIEAFESVEENSDNEKFNLFDETPFNVVEAKYTIWFLPEKFNIENPDCIDCQTSIMYCYKPELDHRYRNPIGFIYEEEQIEILEGGTIRSTGLPEDGIQELLEFLEERFEHVFFDEYFTYEFPDNLNPRIKKLNKKAYAKALKQKQEYELEVEEKNRKALEIEPQYASINFEISFPSKFDNYHFDLKLTFAKDEKECEYLKISARPNNSSWRGRAIQKSIWWKTVSIPPVKINHATNYLKKWILNKDNIELLKSFHLQPEQTEK